MTKNVVVHVGYHKTGSSWLQKELFTTLDNVTVPYSFEDILQGIVTPHPFVFDEARFWREYGVSLQTEYSEHDALIISSERLSGSPHSGGIDSGLIASRLHRLFPDARILVIVREQMQIIVSNYREYIRGGGTCSLHRYLNPPTANHRSMFNPDFFRYDQFVGQYHDLFGDDQVKVLPFEWLNDCPEQFAAEICDFIGVPFDVDEISFKPVRKGLSDTATQVKRWTNKVTRRNSLNPCTSFRIRGGDLVVQWVLGQVDPLLTVVGRDGVFMEQVVEQFTGYYAASNARLQDYMAADLAALGYDLT